MFTNDSCGSFTSIISFMNTSLTWSSGDEFVLSGTSGITIPCTVAPGGITCLGYSEPFMPNTATNLTLKSEGGAVVIDSMSSFSLTETVDVSCQGTGCANYAAMEQAGFPCAYTVDITYEHT